MFGSVHGAFASAHVSSTGDGTRMPWLTPPKTFVPPPLVHVAPAAGLKRR